MINLKEMVEGVIKPVADKVRFEVSESILSGKIACGSDVQVSVEYELAGITEPGADIYKLKKFPIGEENQTAILKGLKQMDFGEFDLALMAVKKDWIDKGIKHTFVFKLEGDKAFVNIKNTPKVVKQPAKVVKKNKFEEVREYGKN